MTFLLVAGGGFLGAMARYYLGLRFNKKRSNRPYGTWIANVSGSIVLGYLFVLYEQTAITTAIWLLAGVGFCGAYTTFSTFGTETVTMILAKQIKKATIYVTTSLMVSISLVAVIYYLCK